MRRNDFDVLIPGDVRLRHVKLGTGDGQASVMGKTYVPSWDGINGPGGFTSGSYERRVGEEGVATVELPNGAGSDGRLHRDRFLIGTEGQAVSTVPEDYAGGGYRPGDEWIEIWKDGDLKFNGTPISYQVTTSGIVLQLVDAFWLLKKVRESAAGFWNDSPVDVMAYYAHARQMLAANSFADAYTYAGSAALDSLGWEYYRTESLTAHPSQAVMRAASGEFSYMLGPSTGLTGNLNQLDFVAEAAVEWDGALNSAVIVCGIADAGVQQLGMNLTAGFAELAAVDAVPKYVPVTLPPPGPFNVQIECRGPWAYYYLNGELLGVQPVPGDIVSDLRPSAGMFGQTASTSVRLSRMSLHRLRPLMQRTPTYELRIGGEPVEQGLVGSYFNYVDIAGTDANYFDQLLKPVDEPVTRRVDQQLNFTGSWAPPGVVNLGLMGVRWTGAIYLPLDQATVKFRITHPGNMRFWIGHSRQFQGGGGSSYSSYWLGAQATSQVVNTGPSVTTQLGITEAGWYPIVIEMATRSNGAGTDFKIEWSTDNFATAHVLGDRSQAIRPKLAAVGTYNEHVRFDSHYDQVKAVASRFAIQFTCDPKPLESGYFGELRAAPRVGRDTDKVLTADQAGDSQLTINAEDCADQLIADGANLGETETTTVAQVTNEGEWLSHPFLMQEVESLSDIADADQLLQRLSTLLVLRGSTWEEIAAKPTPARPELRDAFELSGELAVFDWEAGDGVRVQQDALGVDDVLPRQFLVVNRPFVPKGLGAPIVSFRQRPRSVKETLRAILRQAITQKRNYQGQLAVIQGDAVANGGTSKVALPVNLADVVSATLRVIAKSNASAWAIAVNGTTIAPTFTAVGPVDITRYVAVATGRQDMYATVASGTGTVEFQLELVIRI